MFSFDTNTRINAGSQASVVHGNFNGSMVAVKVFPPTSEGAKTFGREKYILNAMKKKSNIVPMLCESEANLAIGLKKFDCDLFTYMFEQAHEPNVNLICKIMKQICKGTSHLHNAGIAHLDIKPENILVDTSKLKFYICDFGLSFVGTRTKDGLVPRIGRLGSAEYMAPEVKASQKDYNPFAADIYSIGTLLFVLLTGRFLPEEISDDFEFLLDFGFPRIIESFLRALLNPLPESRPSIEEVLRHPFLKKERGQRRFLKKFAYKASTL